MFEDYFLHNSDTIAYIIYAFVIAIFASAFYINRRRLRAFFQEQASRRNGRIKGFLSPRLIFPFKNLEISFYVTQGGKNSPPYSHVTTKLNLNTKFTMKIYREGYFSGLGKALGMQDIQVHNPAFDDAFMIKGSDPDIIRSLLSKDVQQVLIDIKDLNPSINFYKTHFAFMVPQLPKDQLFIDKVIDKALVVIDKIQQSAFR